MHDTKLNPRLAKYSGEFDPSSKYTLLCVGGGSSSGDSKEARELYRAQADTARFMLGMAQDNLPGALDSYINATNQYFDPAYEARMVGQAGADAQQAIATNTAAMGRNLSRFGINPNSGRFAGVAGTNAIQGAALQAGAMQTARNRVQDKRLGASKDLFSTMVGLPSDAANAAGNAAAGFSGLASNAQQQQRDNWTGVGQLAGLGLEAYRTFADGGHVDGYAGGGLVGGGGLTKTQFAPPPQMPSGSSPMMQAASDAKAGLSLYKNAQSALQGVGHSMANGMAAGTAEALGTAGAAGEQAAMLAAQDVGMTGLGEVVGAAAPWVGAALALASLFKADGGYVEGYANGGKVLNTKTSMVDYLKSKGLDSSFETRKRVFEAMYGEPYKGTAEQNMRAFTDVRRKVESAGVKNMDELLAKPAPKKAAMTPKPKESMTEQLGLRKFGEGRYQPAPVDPRRDAIEGVYPETYMLAAGRVPTATAMYANPTRGASAMRPNMRGLDLRMSREISSEGRKFADGGRADMRTGGDVDGPGTEVSDSIPAQLSDGEFVVNAEAVKMPGVRELLEDINDEGLKRRYGYANGGQVMDSLGGGSSCSSGFGCGLSKVGAMFNYHPINMAMDGLGVGMQNRNMPPPIRIAKTVWDATADLFKKPTNMPSADTRFAKVPSYASYVPSFDQSRARLRATGNPYLQNA